MTSLEFTKHLNERSDLMNMLRTIQRKEKDWWVNLLFHEGPHNIPDKEWVPDYPPRFPFPFRIRRPVTGGFLYLVFRGQIIGFGRIQALETHDGEEVGTKMQRVRGGSQVILDGPFQRMPFDLPCRGFQGLRYTDKSLYELSATEARNEIRFLNLEPKLSS